MRALLPSSLNGYLLLGIGVITMPLLAAILNATFQMRRLTDFSQALVNESVHTTELIQDMFELRNSLGQKAQVYQVLGSGQDLANFNKQDAALNLTMSELRAVLRAAEARGAVDTFTGIQREITDSVRAPVAARAGGGAAAIRAMPDFAPLDEQAARISHYANAQQVTELTSLEDQTNTARRLLFWESSLLIPLALAATLSFTLGIGRPIRQVDRAITELGSGNFAREIAVSGP